MRTLALSLGWAGLFLIAAAAAGHASYVCTLSENTVCRKLHPSLQLSCVKHVQLAVAACLRSRRTERFGSHEDHCRVVCRAGVLAVNLDRRLRGDALETAELSAGGDEAWLSGAQSFWQRKGSEGKVCDDGGLAKAQSDCETHCATTARRRDVEELQGLAAGKDFLPLQQPTFGCQVSSVPDWLSRDAPIVLDQLYPPGHPRRATDAVE